MGETLFGFVCLTDNLAVIGAATLVASENPGKRERPLWSPRMPGGVVAARISNLLAFEPKGLHVFRHLMRPFCYDLIVLTLVVHQLPFVELVAQHVPQTNGRPIVVWYPWAFKRSATSLNENRLVA